MITTKTMERPKRGLYEQSYLPEVVKGIGVTTRHMLKNFFGKTKRPTWLYPEKKRTYPARFRGVHRLMVRDNGEVRCVACMCCSTACPANCITIEAEEAPDKSIEKRPKRFDINLLLCVYCGKCVEACPCDAIRMDTGEHPLPTHTRKEQIIRIDELLSRGTYSIAKQGGEGT